LDLGALDPIDTQIIYDAVSIARGRNVVPDTMIFCYPVKPLVCIGYHQELEKEVDIDVCRQLGVPVVRRILGGGAVYLDNNQLFYQIIASIKNPMLPPVVEDAFRFFLQGPVETYRSLGVPAVYRPINDIIVGGRKISGNGATTTVYGVFVLTGNIILDFNYEMMVKILKAPSEKFRDKMFKSLQEWVTTLRRELGYLVPVKEVKSTLEEAFEKTLGVSLQKGTLTSEENGLLQELRKRYLSNEWLFMPEHRHPNLIETRAVKVVAGISVAEAAYKSRGGLIRVTMEMVESKIKDILISGDFSFYPPDALPKLEQILAGTVLDRTVVTDKVRNFYITHNVQSPGTEPDDFSTVILMAAEEGRAR